MPKVVSEAYFHIGNGGVTFKVEDEGHGPTVVVESSHFATTKSSISLRLEPAALKVLARLFEVAAEAEYSKTWCHSPDLSRCRCKPVGEYDGLLPKDEEHGCCRSGGFV